MQITESYVNPARGILAHIIGKLRPELARHIAESGRIDTAVIGLGKQGTQHAGLMKAFGTTVAAAVAPGKESTRVHESIPVFASVTHMLNAHPYIAAVSIWKHFSTAAVATLEAINAGIPVVVLVTEGMPVKDVRDLVVAARQKNVLLIGPNTPGMIFPPERVKIGMLPDIFHPAEPEPGKFSTEGVTICSRSGAILYHMSDALASAGIAQNAVIGVGGDSVVGTPFPKLVPLVMDYPGTDLVVLAGEIGGCQEELLAKDMLSHPGDYPKPVVALVSGRNAPEGKTMGHAGALVAPGAQYGTFETKKAALESAGVTVVNSQTALVEAVREALGRRLYFIPERYHARMKATWDVAPAKPSWFTSITLVEPNHLVIRGYPLADLIGKRTFLEVAGLLVTGRIPRKRNLSGYDALARNAAKEPVPRISFSAGDHLSKRLAAMLLADKRLASFQGSELERTAYCLGRMAAYFARVFGNEIRGKAADFSELACTALIGRAAKKPGYVKLIEAAMVASVDHGVTPPSAQAAILASSVRSAFEVAVASGLSAITHVHGGAGADAAEFFLECASECADNRRSTVFNATCEVMSRRIAAGKRIEGMGHRLHTRDPRRDALWSLARRTGIAGPCVAVSRIAEGAMKSVRGISLPINVDGVIGAIIADMGLDPQVAAALFIFGRAAGLAAHYFEEVSTQPPMRRIDFSQAVCKEA